MLVDIRTGYLSGAAEGRRNFLGLFFSGELKAGQENGYRNSLVSHIYRYVCDYPHLNDWTKPFFEPWSTVVAKELDRSLTIRGSVLSELDYVSGAAEGRRNFLGLIFYYHT